MILHLMFLEILSRKKRFSRIHCNYVFLKYYYNILHNFIFQDVSSLFLTFFTCYSTRCFLSFFLLITRFSHSLQFPVHSVAVWQFCSMHSFETICLVKHKSTQSPSLSACQGYGWWQHHHDKICSHKLYHNKVSEKCK